MINKMHVREVFESYTSNYNSNDVKIKLKIDHTLRVAELSVRIAESIGLNEEKAELAWLIGMLHDIGRFEQVKRYGTFSDALSIDHAKFGADLLFKEGLIDIFATDLPLREREIVERAIRNHSSYRIDEGLDAETAMFCNVIRDADKIDILKVNTELPLEEIYNVSTDIIKNSSVTPEVLKAFYEEHAVLRNLKKTPVDNVVAHISLVYELCYEESFRILNEQAYIYRMMEFKSCNEETNEKFAGIKSYMSDFIKRKVSI